MRRDLSLVGVMLVVALGASLITARYSTQIARADRVPYTPGDVFAAVGKGKVKHFNASGTLLDTLDTTTGSAEITGMAFDTKGNLYVTNFTENVISKFDRTGALLGGFGGSFSEGPESLIFDKDGNVYVGQAKGTKQVRKFDPEGKPLATFNPQTEKVGVDWIDLAADQCTLFYTSEGRLVKRFDVCANKQLSDFVQLSDGTQAFALRIRPNGEVLVATREVVYRLNFSSAVIQTYRKPDRETSPLFALNLDPDGTSFWTAGYNSGNIYKINIETGNVETTFNAGLQNTTLAGLAVYSEIVVAQPTALVPLPQASATVVTTSTSPAAQPTLLPAALPETGDSRDALWQPLALLGLVFLLLGLLFGQHTLDHYRVKRE